jgi:hypothetical protein
MKSTGSSLGIAIMGGSVAWSDYNAILEPDFGATSTLSKQSQRNIANYLGCLHKLLLTIAPRLVKLMRQHMLW